MYMDVQYITVCENVFIHDVVFTVHMIAWQYIWQYIFIVQIRNVFTRNLFSKMHQKCINIMCRIVMWQTVWLHCKSFFCKFYVWHAWHKIEIRHKTTSFFCGQATHLRLRNKTSSSIEIASTNILCLTECRWNKNGVH